jgi:hypothetical protein
MCQFSITGYLAALPCEGGEYKVEMRSETSQIKQEGCCFFEGSDDSLPSSSVGVSLLDRCRRMIDTEIQGRGKIPCWERERSVPSSDTMEVIDIASLCRRMEALAMEK